MYVYYVRAFWYIKVQGTVIWRMACLTLRCIAFALTFAATLRLVTKTRIRYASSTRCNDLASYFEPALTASSLQITKLIPWLNLATYFCIIRHMLLIPSEVMLSSAKIVWLWPTFSCVSQRSFLHIRNTWALSLVLTLANMDVYRQENIECLQARRVNSSCCSKVRIGFKSSSIFPLTSYSWGMSNMDFYSLGCS